MIGWVVWQIGSRVVKRKIAQNRVKIGAAGVVVLVLLGGVAAAKAGRPRTRRLEPQELLHPVHEASCPRMNVRERSTSSQRKFGISSASRRPCSTGKNLSSAAQATSAGRSKLRTLRDAACMSDSRADRSTRARSRRTPALVRTPVTRSA